MNVNKTVNIDYTDLIRINGQASINQIPRDTKIIIAYYDFRRYNSENQLALTFFMAKMQIELNRNKPTYKKRFIDYIFTDLDNTMSPSFYLYNNHCMNDEPTYNLPDFWKPIPEDLFIVKEE